MEWPHPEKITARPQSHQCSPDKLERMADGRSGNGEVIHGKTKTIIHYLTRQCSTDVISIINFLFQAESNPVRVSLVAAPMDAFPASENLLHLETASNATSSSRASTIFSYPWDLPPPQFHGSTSTPVCPLKWATLQRHLSQMEASSQPLSSASPTPPNSLKLKENGHTSDAVIIEERPDGKSGKRKTLIPKLNPPEEVKKIGNKKEERVGEITIFCKSTRSR